MTNTLVRWLEEFTSRMGTMEERVAAVERALGATHAKPHEDRLAHAPPPMPVVVEETPVENRMPRLCDLKAKLLIRGDVASEASNTNGSLEGDVVVESQTEEDSTLALETAIGRNWTSWIGAIVVVLGVLFFLKYAWDQGWLELTPAARVWCAIGLGGLFVAAGEWMRIWKMRILAATLAGAGVAMGMGAFLAGHALFESPVFSAGFAAAGVGLWAALGIALALRMNVLTLAIIALLGAYLAPVVLTSGRDQSLALMGYLGALAAVGWALAYLRPNWRAMRWFTWGWTVLWMIVWLERFALGGEHIALGLAATAFFFIGFIGEIYLSIERAFAALDENDPAPLPAFITRLENSLALLGLLTSGLTFAACYALLNGSSGSGLVHLHPLAGIALGMAAIHVMLAQATASKQFARANSLAAAGLATLAVPLIFGRVAVTGAWLIMALALAGLAWRRRGTGTKIWAVCLLMLALVRLFSFDWIDPSINAPWGIIGGQPISIWLLMACAAALATHAIAWLCQPINDATPQFPLASLLAGIGTMVFFAATAMAWHGAALTLLWLTWTAALLALSSVPQARQLPYAAHAAACIAVIALKWLTIDELRPIVQSWNQPSDVWPICNWPALAGALLITLSIRLRKRLDDEIKPIVPVVIGMISFALTTFEMLRAVDLFAADVVDIGTMKATMLSVLWALLGLAGVTGGFVRELRPLRYAALTLLGLVLGKIVLIDLAAARPVYRILSFLAVGMMLLLVSFVYHRVERHN